MREPRLLEVEVCILGQDLLALLVGVWFCLLLQLLLLLLLLGLLLLRLNVFQGVFDKHSGFLGYCLRNLSNFVNFLLQLIHASTSSISNLSLKFVLVI